ncbi:GlsB/YeaQ/YmgE family stress response membrane protein [Phenylobacterium sp. 20VBR1]|uniref:GlsB/YeaQ/YmgE family stress response membrane protein n=1 Tax=Phenylobacterium glaciei TaxID=2803784 RepID=A0A941HX90_9CAUL|nr:GlsB/YeaQ/YmgE family stress response membrane protein [Phenylobacterium glaciei]MBR7620072.1 GlsB/YeaQ/YmgE family stress response membrane protein [Phenylobacterium glaciei]
MDGVGLYGEILIVMLAGWFAALALGRRHSLFVYMAVGFVGALLGHAIATGLDIQLVGVWGSLIAATVGSILFLAPFAIFRRR